MARSKNFISIAFYIMMSFIAINFVALCIYLVLMPQFGFYTLDDLKDIGQVFVGNRKYVLSREQISEYNELKAERERLLQDLGRADGTDDTRKRSAEALDDMRKQLEERIRALRELRSQHEQHLADLRANIEQIKSEKEKERKALEDWKQQTTKAELSDRHKLMTTTLRAMEPEVLANLLLGNMQKAGGAEENARIIRQYLTPDITAEVMTILPERDMRQIVPLLENKYADMSPEMIVKIWTTPGTADFKTPEQMAIYMRSMAVPQAFTIFTLLDAKTRAELVRLLK